MLKGIIVLAGIVMGLAVGIVAGVMVGMSPAGGWLGHRFCVIRGIGAIKTRKK